MKIKEITDPTLRWAVIKRLLDRVPDRPAGAGNFVSDGSFSEPSRRKMPGRHAAERAAKQVWNEVVDELGSRPFFDDTLVKVHWIGLYTKRDQDLAGNVISFIQAHVGIDHADEISATAYLGEDLAKVPFTRPMVGVILRGRTTYAGAVDLGTQWSVKLKPADIERQKGSGTRKLPWYEDEGTIALNMTVDETSWRDHVWGPQYYKSKMPELVVGSWSFDTVLIPQSVMSGAPDDMQRVIEVASSLGCKVVDERGNTYEQGEKMQITESRLRQIIREELTRNKLNEASALDSPGTRMYNHQGVKFLGNPKAIIDIDPPVLDFGDVPVGDSKTLYVTLRNPWAYPVYITEANSNRDEIMISFSQESALLLRYKLVDKYRTVPVVGKSEPDGHFTKGSFSTIPLAGTDEKISYDWVDAVPRGTPKEVKMGITFKPGAAIEVKGEVSFRAGHEGSSSSSPYDNTVTVRGRGVQTISDPYGRFITGNPRGRNKVSLISHRDYDMLKKSDPELAALVDDYDNLTPADQRAVENELRKLQMGRDLEDAL